MTDRVTVTLDTCDPQALIQNDDCSYAPAPSVALRFLPDSEHTGWPEVEVSGERADVRAFVAMHWGEDDLDVLMEQAEDLLV